MLARILGWSNVTGPFTCPRENDKGLAQETEKHSCPWWQLRVPPFLGCHSHATHLTFLVRPKAQNLDTHIHIQETEILAAEGALRQALELVQVKGGQRDTGTLPARQKAGPRFGRAPAKAGKRFRWNKVERGEGAEQGGHKS